MVSCFNTLVSLYQNTHSSLTTQHQMNGHRNYKCQPCKDLNEIHIQITHKEILRDENKHIFSVNWLSFLFLCSIFVVKRHSWNCISYTCGSLTLTKLLQIKQLTSRKQYWNSASPQKNIWPEQMLIWRNSVILITTISICPACYTNK